MSLAFISMSHEPEKGCWCLGVYKSDLRFVLTYNCSALDLCFGLREMGVLQPLLPVKLEDRIQTSIPKATV